MLDNQDMKSLIVSQVESAVEKYVAAVLSDSSWQQNFENQIIRHLQNRVTAKFSNISEVPEIKNAIKEGVESMFDRGMIPGIETYLDHDRLEKVIKSTAENAVENITQQMTIDPDWLEKVQKSLTASMTQRLLRQISLIDINSAIADAVDQGIERWQDRLLSRLRTGGILDSAQTCELTVVDGAVVVSNGLATESFLVQKDAEMRGTATINNLVVTGNVNTNDIPWRDLTARSAELVQKQLTDQWKQSLINDVLDHARSSGISFDSILINDVPLVSGNVLNPNITDTNIQKLGTLRDLAVSGKTTLADTLYTQNRRVGINTQDPEMVLTLWDEEVVVVAGKHSLNTAFIGTNRKQNLGLGVNKKIDLHIDDQGLVAVKSLRIDRWRIQHNDSVPGWSGTKGDFVINSNPSEKSAFAWICLGGFKWQQLMAKP
jgi:hypothetical protein